LTAFNADRYLNQFLHDWRHNDDGEEFFLRRQQGKIKEFDGLPQPPYTMPPTPTAQRRPSAQPSQTVRPRPAQPAPAVAGAGPQTAANRAAKERAVHFAARAATPPRRLFSALDKDSDSDVEMGEGGKTDLESDVEMIEKGKGKMKEKAEKEKKVAGKEKPMKKSRADETSEVDILIPVPPRPIIMPTRKPAVKAVRYLTEDESEGEGEGEHKVIVSRPKGKPRPVPVATGEFHDPPCEPCQKFDRPCGKEQSGGACFSCKRNKHKCEYSRPNAARQMKSRAVVEESEWEDAAGPGAASGATTSRAARPAAKKAKKAIRDYAATAPKPVRPTRKINPPALDTPAALNAVAGKS
jgi:hypothetical protein